MKSCSPGEVIVVVFVLQRDSVQKFPRLKKQADAKIKAGIMAPGAEFSQGRGMPCSWYVV